MTRITALATRIIRGFRRDRRSLALLVVVPAIVMALIGYLVGDSGKEPLEVGFVEQPAATPEFAAFQDAFRQALSTQPGVHVQTFQDPASAQAAVGDGTLAGTVAAQPGGSTGATVVVTVSGEDVQIESTVVQAATVASAQARGFDVAPGSVPGVEVRRVSLPTNERPSTISFAAPAMITVFAFLFVFMLTSVSFLRERSSGTLERLLASPIGKAEILVGYLLGFLGFAVLQTLIVLGYATLVLHAQVSGPVWVVFLVLVLLVVGVVNLGIVLSFEARNELQVVQFIPLVLLPQIFLGGLWWPVATLWPPLQWLSSLFPVTHAVHALRLVMLAGSGSGDVTGDLAALALFAAAMVALGLVVLRRLRT